MMMCSLPILKLNDAITSVIAKIKSLDIQDSIKKGLNPEVQIVDKDGRSLTTIAEIIDLGNTISETRYCVKISATYAQFLWLLCDIAFRINDSIAIQNEFEQLNEEEKKDFIFHLKDNTPESHYLSELSDMESVFSYCTDSILIISKLLNGMLTDKEMDDLYNYDMTGIIGPRVNSLYVYATSFILLHEFSHYYLNHDFSGDGSYEEETEADQEAFWSMYSDLEDKEKRTAMRGILCALVSLIFINKDLQDDSIHPKPVERIFQYYEYLKCDGQDYSALLCYLFYAWAVYTNDMDLPKHNGCKSYPELLNKIKKHLLDKEDLSHR